MFLASSNKGNNSDILGNVEKSIYYKIQNLVNIKRK